jgi:hypothetical protein
MNPYRSDEKKQDIERAPDASDDGGILLSILLLGLLLVVYDAGQSEPWGAVGSLGMLISFLALKSLIGLYITRLRGGRGAMFVEPRPRRPRRAARERVTPEPRS